MANKFLDSNGLLKVWDLIKTNFVKQEKGKGLSTNDFTDDEKTKLAGIDSGAQPNQFAYSSVKLLNQSGVEQAGQLEADEITDTLKFKPGKNIVLSLIEDSVVISSETDASDIRLADKENDGLMSSTDFTKLDGIETGANVNVIESITVNGELATISDKSVSLTIPTSEEIEQSINSKLAGVYTYKGSIKNESELPPDGNKNGDVYNIEESGTYGPAGTNVAWDEANSRWDALGGSVEVAVLSDSEIQTTFDSVFGTNEGE